MAGKRLSRNCRKAIIFEGTGTANSAFDTGILNTEEWEALTIRITAVSGTFAAVTNQFEFFDSDDATMSMRSGTLTAGQSFATSVIHPGADASGAGNGGVAFNSHVPEKLRYSVAALGVGVSARITVWGQRYTK